MKVTIGNLMRCGDCDGGLMVDFVQLSDDGPKREVLVCFNDKCHNYGKCFKPPMVEVEEWA